MPRRIVGSANYGLYASLTKQTRKTFLRLFATIIYDVGTDEVAGKLRASGIDTRKERLGKFELTATIWLTDTAIAVQAIAFTGPGCDDDDDERNEAHELCEFEFEYEGGQWRLVQVSGIPLPTPETVNRASCAAGTPKATGIFVATSSVAARITNQIADNFHSMLAATGHYLRGKTPIIPVLRPDSYRTLFISYSRTVSPQRSQDPAESFERGVASYPLNGTTALLSWSNTIARSILRGAGIICTTQSQSIEHLLRRTEHSVSTLLTQNQQLLSLLARHNDAAKTDAFVHMETLSRFPERSRKLLVNLLKFNTERDVSAALTRANRATWNSLIVRPITIICADRIILNKPMPIILKPTNASRKNNAAPSRPADKLPTHVKALPRQRDLRRLPRQDVDTPTLP